MKVRTGGGSVTAGDAAYRASSTRSSGETTTVESTANTFDPESRKPSIRSLRVTATATASADDTATATDDDTTTATDDDTTTATDDDTTTATELGPEG